MNKILIAVDFSAVSAELIRVGAEFAGSRQAELFLVHVTAPNPDFIGYEVGPQTVRDNLATRYHEEHRQLQSMEADLTDRGIEVTALLLQGPTIEKLLSEAARLEVGMIIMGSHGHSALHDLLVGSVTDGVLRKSNVPVLVVPAHQG